VGAPSREGVRRLTRFMRITYLGVAVAVFFIGLSLFVLTEDTDSSFAWTINPPITAAFLGAGYWSGLLMLILAAREQTWAAARVAVPVAFTLDTALLLATFIHLERFHMDTVIGWLWLITYSSLLVALPIALHRQLAEPGGDPPRVAPIPGWMRRMMAVQAAGLFGLGLALFVAPSDVGEIWPWELTPLTGRAVGGMLMTHAAAAAVVAYEGAWERVYAPSVSSVLLGVLHAIVLVRYGDTLDWGHVGTWAYVAFAAGALVAGAYAWREAAVARRTPEPALA
jgi:hypothetical protein